MAPPELDLDADDANFEGAVQRPAIPIWTRIRVLTLAALGPLVTGYAAIAALLALVTAIATKAHFSTAGVLSAATPSWLAAHQVPVSIFGLELGVLPLLPTIGLMAITARAAGGAAERLALTRPGQAGQVIATIAAAHGICGVILALVSAGEDVRADPLAGFYYPTLVATVAATIGVARRCRLLAAIAERADEVAVAGLRTGVLAVTLLLTAGAALFTFGLLTSVATARDLFPLGIGNTVGMLLLSIGYLPNAVVAATSFIAGPGFSMGAVAVGPLEFTGGPVPGLPLLAALPESAAGWWPVLFVAPLAVGILVGRRLRDVAEDPVSRLRGVAVAAGVVALSFVVLAGSAGGRVGTGPFDPVSMRAAAVSVALVLWISIPAAITTWWSGPRPARENLPGLIDDDMADADEEPAEDPAELAEDAAEPAENPADAAENPADAAEEPVEAEAEPAEAMKETAEAAEEQPKAKEELADLAAERPGAPGGPPKSTLPTTPDNSAGSASEQPRDQQDSDQRTTRRAVTPGPATDRASADRASADRASADRARVDRAGVDRASADRARVGRASADSAIAESAASRPAPVDRGRADGLPGTRRPADELAPDTNP